MNAVKEAAENGEERPQKEQKNQEKKQSLYNGSTEKLNWCIIVLNCVCCVALQSDLFCREKRKGR